MLFCSSIRLHVEGLCWACRVPCHESANRTEHSGIKLNNTGIPRRPDRSAYLLPSCLRQRAAWLCPRSQIDFLGNSIMLWNEQPVLVDKKKKKKKVLDWVPSFWNGNVSHFHEYWIESATACESSLSSAIDIMQTLSCTSSKPFFFFFFAWSPINVFAQSEFAQTLYRGALTSVCQKWCQCSHGNYSYTLPHALPQLEWHSALFVCQMSDLISRQVAVNAEGVE